ncbi:MAG: NYN domain-containing protein [Chloroflexia bacterium]|nr:NYN domain-containing protein [Chloroflexia bacterium]
MAGEGLGAGRAQNGGAEGREVAVFVDYENIRYSTINSFGREPDPLSWRDKALKYGLMSVARAYADFDQHPLQARTRLDVAGFEAQHYPVKRTVDATGREKVVSRSDLNMVIDIINTALVRPDVHIFLLFTGDKDFIRLVTTLRNRLGRRVVICGVPGSVSPDLVAAAGEEDALELAQSAENDAAVILAIDAYVRQLHEGFVPTQSHMSRTLWRFLDRGVLPSEHIEAKVMEFLRKGVLTKRQTINGQGQELVTTELNLQHPLVVRALPHGTPPATATSPNGDDDDREPFDDDAYVEPSLTGANNPELEAGEDDELDADDQARVLAASTHFRNEQERLASRESSRYQRRFGHEPPPTWRTPRTGN